MVHSQAVCGCCVPNRQTSTSHLRNKIEFTVAGTQAQRFPCGALFFDADRLSKVSFQLSRPKKGFRYFPNVTDLKGHQVWLVRNANCNRAW